jgi:small subunit ribosomal protein S8
MSMSDPIADLLTRIRNAVQAQHPTVDVPLSKLKVEIARVMKEEGFIEGYEVSEATKPGLLRIALKYTASRQPVLQGIRRVSKPSLRVHEGSKALKPVRSGLGISIVSTSKGVMTGKQARRERVGGEIICEVW